MIDLYTSAPEKVPYAVERWFDSIGARPAVQRGMAVPKVG